MDKLISQQAAIDALKELTANGTNKGMVFGEDAVHRIEMLPSVQPEQRWIPVEERLPEVGQAVIVTTKNGYRAIRKCIDAGHLKWFYNDIIAWMPSPEPYQKRGEQE